MRWRHLGRRVRKIAATGPVALLSRHAGDQFASTVVVPGKLAGAGPLATWLIANVRRLGEQLCIPPVRVRDYHAGADPWKVIGSGFLSRRRTTCLAVNVRFLLGDSPPAWPLVQRASQGQLVLYGDRATGELYACAFPASRLSRPQLDRLLAYLTRCNSVRDDGWAGTPDALIVDAGFEPAMRARAGSYAASYVNAAFSELLDGFEDGGTGTEPDGLARALVAHRDRSTVPWIWNTLANEVEHRAAQPVLVSFPQEMHLSVTGRCNIECQFCSYSHEAARSDFVDRARIERLAVLQHLRTIRLSSGLGEPTIHPHLAGIVGWLAERLPHLELNFFTNGVQLSRGELRAALVGRLSWMNVSLNAATRAGWNAVSGGDHFERITGSLRALTAAKRAQGVREPLVRGSIVLTTANLEELPRMPALCRELGVAYLTAIPFFSLGYERLPRLSGKDSLHARRARYDELYEATIVAARDAGVSVELPLPSDHGSTRFGLEARRTHDFAGVGQRPVLGRLLDGDPGRTDAGTPCPALWRDIYLGSTARTHVQQAVTHYAYPCLGPLSSVDFSDETGFDFPVGSAEFLEFWNNPLHRHLREGQSQPGTCVVCDICRSTDTRNPPEFPRIEDAIAVWRGTRPSNGSRLGSRSVDSR